MKKSSAVIFCICLATTAAHAAQPPAELQAARKALAAAISAHDLKAIVALTNFPLAVESYQTAPKLTAAKFRKDKNQFTDIFADGQPSTVKCIGADPLSFQNDAKAFGGATWFADCNGFEYYFGQRGGKWLLTAYQNIDE